MPACRKLFDGPGDAIALAADVEPAFGGDFLALFGHQRGLIGLHLAGDGEDFRLAGHFQVELHGDRFAEDPQVAVGDVAAVLAEVEGDAVGPAQFGQRGRPNGVRLVGAPGLPHRGHVIDIDAKLGHEG